MRQAKHCVRCTFQGSFSVFSISKWEFDTYQNGLGYISDTYPNPYPPVAVPPYDYSKEVFGPDIPRTSRGHSRGYPCSKLRSGHSKPLKNKHFGADIHDPKARTSTTLRDFRKLRSEKLRAEFSFPNFGSRNRSGVLKYLLMSYFCSDLLCVSHCSHESRRTALCGVALDKEFAPYRHVAYLLFCSIAKVVR